MAYQSNLMGDFWRGQRQRRLATGTSLTQNEMGGLLRPTLDTEAAMAEAAARREQQQGQFNQQMDLRKNEVANQRLAGMVGGVGQMAMLPLAYGAGKSMGWWGSNAPPAAAQPAGLLGGQSAVAPAAAGATTAQGGLLSAPLGGAAYPGVAGGTTLPGQAGGMSLLSNAPAAVPGAGSSLMGAAGPIAGLAGAQLATGLAAQPTMNKIGLPMTGKGFTYGGLPGAMAGGVYDVVHGIVGGISKMF